MQENTFPAMCSLHQAWWKIRHSLRREVLQVELERNPKETIQVDKKANKAFAQIKSKFNAHEKLLKKLLKRKESKRKNKKHYDSDSDSDSS